LVVVTVRVEVRPSVLEWARTRSGLEDHALAKAFPKYAAWLAGEGGPTLKQLQEFAQRTHTPVGYLFLDEPPLETVPIPDFRTVAGHPVGRAGAVSADLLDVIYACERRQEWYRDHQLLNGEPPVAFVGAARPDVPVERAADQLRDLLGWTAEQRLRCRSWDAALTWLREQSEVCGVLVMISGVVGPGTNRKLDPEEFRGFALADSYAPIVFVNGADGKAAQVFTLAHELAHLLLGETALSDLDPESTRANAIERWCNQVAAELLVPMAEFRERFDPAADLREQLNPLAHHFRVSTQVILGRIRETGLLTWDQYFHEVAVESDRVAEVLDERAASGGDYYNTKGVNLGKRFARAVVGSALEGQTPYPQAFRLLGLKKASTFDRFAEKLGVI
jgi:Zn-dependent peptidase ImmA (M78 family)